MSAETMAVGGRRQMKTDEGNEKMEMKMM